MLDFMKAAGAPPIDFAPELLALQTRPPSPLPRAILLSMLLLFAVTLGWAAIGRLDIVAVAEGKLVPVSYLKIVQPADAGIVHDILVQEGQHVTAGQLLVRMDAILSQADSKSVQGEMQHKALELRRVEAELAGAPFKQVKGDSPELFRNIEAEYLANRRSLEDAYAEERAVLEKSKQELAATMEIQHKLEQTLPSYRAQEQAYAKLGKDGALPEI